SRPPPGFDRSRAVGYDPLADSSARRSRVTWRLRFRPESRRMAHRVLADYAQSYRTLWERHWWWRAPEAVVLRWMRRLHARSPRTRILDAGCGDGLFFEKLQPFGDVDGL